MSFDDFVTLLTKAMNQSGQDQGFAFDGLVKNLEELYKDCDRQELIDKLKGFVSKCKASDWVPVAHRIDFMSASERDLHLRYRNRIQSFKRRTSGTDYAKENLSFLQDELGKIDAK